MRTVITRARVFDGHRLREPDTVVLDGDRIGTDPTGAEVVIDASDATLLPGLIDAHLHLHGRDDLEHLTAWGVTTGLDMATWPAELLASLRHAQGLTDIRSSGLPAIGPGGPHARMPGMPPEAVMREPAQAEPFVASRAAEGVDYLKIVAEAPTEGGPDQATLDALVIAAHHHGMRVIAHASSCGAFDMALDAGVDMITHAPLDHPLDAATVQHMATNGLVSIPTLAMMESIASIAPDRDYSASRDSVTALHHASVPILAGTDANAAPGAPSPIRHGESLHHELELLVDGGLPSIEALRAATVLPATHFDLADRGALEPGLRADLLLIDGDPLTDIRATRNITRIWCGGDEYTHGQQNSL